MDTHSYEVTVILLLLFPPVILITVTVFPPSCAHDTTHTQHAHVPHTRDSLSETQSPRHDALKVANANAERAPRAERDPTETARVASRDAKL